MVSGSTLTVDFRYFGRNFILFRRSRQCFPIATCAIGRSIRLGGQSTALLRTALAWAAQGTAGGGKDGAGEQATAKAAVMYGDFRAVKEGAEEVRKVAMSGLKSLPIHRTYCNGLARTTANEERVIAI